MKTSEITTVLDAIAGFDGRTWTPAARESWIKVIGAYPLEDAMRAVTEHYSGNETRIMPVHVRQRCQHLAEMRAAAEQRALPAPPRPVLTEVGRRARAETFAAIRRVAGNMDRALAERPMRADPTSPTSPDSEITEDTRRQWLDRLAAAS